MLDVPHVLTILNYFLRQECRIYIYIYIYIYIISLLYLELEFHRLFSTLTFQDCGKSFKCDDLNCAFLKRTSNHCFSRPKLRPQSIRNNGINRLSCFRCDHDICDRYQYTILYFTSFPKYITNHHSNRYLFPTYLEK